MKAYIDSSVLLRKIFGEPNPLKELEQISYGIASELIRVECLRTADRYRIINKETERDFLNRLSLLHDAFEHLELIRISPDILSRSSQSFRTVIRTLDAIHLATCLLYRDKAQNLNDDLVFCTHDKELKKAAQAMGLHVLGASSASFR